MSEPSSLFVHAHITKENLDVFMNSDAKNVGDYHDWLPWFEAEQRVYGDAREVLKNADGRNACPSGYRINLDAEHMSYNPDSEIFFVDNLFLGENFEIFLPLVTALRGLESYVKPNSENNFVIIYPYWWGETSQMSEPPYDMYVEFKDGKSWLPEKIDPENVRIASQYFDAHGEALANEIVEKYGRI